MSGSRVVLKNLRDIRNLKIEKIPEAAIPESLSSYGISSWSLERDGERTVIKRSFLFGDFNEAMSFMNSCAYLADDSDHHPEWFNVYNKVDVLFSTHDATGVTLKDILMAKSFDVVAESIDESRGTKPIRTLNDLRSLNLDRIVKELNRK